MGAAGVRAGGADVDVPLVRELLGEQSPHRTGPGIPVESTGTDDAAHRLSAVVGFTARAWKDPAVALTAAGPLLPAHARGVFRDAVDADEATRVRGRGWALPVAPSPLVSHRHTRPAPAANARRGPHARPAGGPRLRPCAVEGRERG